MNILLICSGSREHSIAIAIKKSPQNINLFCFSNSVNPGIKKLCKNYILGDVLNCEEIKNYAIENNISMVVIGGESQLEIGLADILQENGIKVVGPKKNLAQIETSKGFTRDLLDKYDILGNVFFKRFTSMKGVDEILEKLKNKFVIKADGLCGGKGVLVFGEHLNTKEEAIKHCEMLVDSKKEFVIEEKIEGQEFSLISFSDGVNLIHTPAIQDHKRAFEGDTGPNTGGMGTYSDANHSLPFLSVDDIRKAKEINNQVIKALSEEFSSLYQGILYGGFMATKDGIKVIEYNARFGDPEAMNILTLIKGDFVDVLCGITDGNLDKVDISFENKATVCKYLVPTGYPINAKKGFEINISELQGDVKLFFGAVDEINSKLIATGSRTMALLGLGDTILEAEQMVQMQIDKVEGDLFYRKDIGTKALINKRIKHMNSLRGNIYDEL